MKTTVKGSTQKEVQGLYVTEHWLDYDPTINKVFEDSGALFVRVKDFPDYWERTIARNALLTAHQQNAGRPIIPIKFWVTVEGEHTTDHTSDITIREWRP